MVGRRDPRDWTGAIIAGGLARRFGGRPKWALEVGGRRIIDRQLDALQAVVGTTLIVVSEDVAAPDLPVRVVTDVIPGGALGGVYTALASASTPRVIVLACDMPFVTAPLLERLAEIGETAEAAVPRTEEGLQPLCASYMRDCAGRLRERLERGERRLLDALGDLRVVELGPEEWLAFGSSSFANLNTPDDLARISS